MFAGRKRELGYLEKRYIQANAELLVIYGRRRIGKTELLKHFTADKPHIFYSAIETGIRINLSYFQ